MTDHTYATLFDKKYLAKGECMISSLIRQSEGKAFIYVLALDNFSKEYIENYGEFVQIYTMQDVMTPELKKARGNRTYQEFCWTLASYFTAWVWNKNLGAVDTQELTYLDSDLFFYSDPQPIFDEIGEKSVGIIEHRFIPSKKGLVINGKYNVGWVSFQGPMGKAILEGWARKCLEWCYNRAEPTRFADQKYLDYWKDQYG